MPNIINSEDSLIGQMLDGRFLIEKDLTEGGADKGGIGLVYLAKDMKLMGKETVVKILQKALVKDEDVTRKFLHEKEALIRLDHPNIVRILDSGNLSDGNPFMVMEYIEGYSLRRKLRENKKLDFAVVAHVIESVTNALSAAHSKKVLHRDIKPENIMLTPQEEGVERVRLIDFGIARVEDAKLAPVTTTQRGIGTIFYIAPEQLWGSLEQTPTVDIYSFAIVIYEMLTGELPYKPKSVVEMYELQKEGVKTLPSELCNDLPSQAEDILLSALEFDPQKRPQNARHFGSELAKLLNGKPNVVDTENVNTERIEIRDFATPVYEAKTIITPSSSMVKTNEVTEISETESSVVNKETDSSLVNTQAVQPRRLKTILYLSLLGFVLFLITFAVFSFVVIKPFNPRVSEPTITSDVFDDEKAKSREITYFLNIQKIRGGKPVESVYQSTGKEIFENGYNFNTVFISNDEGYLYVFNESKDSDFKSSYYLLFPGPKTNNGSAQIPAKQQIETPRLTIGGIPGKEIIWIIWIAEKQDDLEYLKLSAFNNQGAIKDQADIKKLKDFFIKYKDRKTEASDDEGNKQVVVKGKGDVVTHRIEIAHN